MLGDYRTFTDWRPRCSTQYEYAAGVNPPGAPTMPTSLATRTHLQRNAQDLMRRNADRASSAVSQLHYYQGLHSASKEDVLPGKTRLAESQTQICDGRTCAFAPNSAGSMGLGRARPQTAQNYSLL
jgi:hypothetical protein